MNLLKNFNALSVRGPSNRIQSLATSINLTVVIKECVFGVCIKTTKLSIQNILGNMEIKVIQKQMQTIFLFQISKYAAYMPCCKKNFYGILQVMRYELISNCCIDGRSCKELFNGTEFTYQYENSLTVGKKCYKQLADRIKYGQHLATKNENDVLELLDKLSTKRCNKCNQRNVNVVIGQEHQIKSGLCFTCWDNLHNQQLKVKNFGIKKGQQQKNQASHYHKKDQKYEQSIQQIPKPKQNRCCKCRQCLILTQNRHLNLIQFEQQLYCYYCLYERFQTIKNKKQSSLMSQTQYIKELIKFQQIFSKHCMLCGVDLGFYSETTAVFIIQSKSMDLKAYYCSSCNRLLQTDIKAFRNLSKLKKSISDKQIIITKVSFSIYQKKMIQKLNKLFNHQNLLVSSKRIEDDKDKFKELDGKIVEPIIRQLLKEVSMSDDERLTKSKSYIFMSNDDNDNQQQPNEKIGSSKSVIQNQQFFEIINKSDNEVKQQFYDCQQLKDQTSHNEVIHQLIIQSQNDENAKSQLIQNIDQSLLVGNNINALLQLKNISISQNNEEQWEDPQILGEPQKEKSTPQPITINLENTIIDYTLDEYRKNPKHPIKLLLLTDHCTFLIKNKERHDISIKMMQQLDAFLKSPNFLKQDYQNENDQKTKFNRLPNDSFIAKQSQCYNCRGLDFFLNFGCLCQQCFTRYLMGEKVKIKSEKLESTSIQKMRYV